MINTFAMFMPGPIEILIVLFVIVLPIYLIIRYTKKSIDERRRLRMELSKLADELEQTRKAQSNK